MLAGCIETLTVVTPSEMVKIRMQTAQGKTSGALSSSSVFTVIRHIVQTEGVGSLYKGMAPTLVRQTTNQGCRFLMYGRVMDEMRQRDAENKRRYWHSFLAGGIAGGVNVYINTPADVVKTRMQNQVSNLRVATTHIDATTSAPPKMIYTSSWDCLIRTARNEGVLALWKGSKARVVRLVPGQAITFGAFGFFESFLSRHI